MNIVINWKRSRLMLEAMEFGIVEIMGHKWRGEMPALEDHGLGRIIDYNSFCLTPEGREFCEQHLGWVPRGAERPNNAAYYAMMGW